ncbi:hypothetical protein GCM10011339_12800 [Echinicola rosea]|uniref:Uncharacterized protein n=1 Tax=Echinicola rosea TaxID=1807691 RepID=A0ABQ1UU06_9BACT|nr:hypothetical protein GCM10011339_12800 [Echinicola rosea]
MASVTAAFALPEQIPTRKYIKTLFIDRVVDAFDQGSGFSHFLDCFDLFGVEVGGPVTDAILYGGFKAVRA